MIPPDPVLDPSDADAALASLLARLPGYAPGLVPAGQGAALAVLQVVARFREAVNRRLNAVPGKQVLAFLDFLGQSLTEPRPARAAVVFTFQPPAAPALPLMLQSMLAAQDVALPVPMAPPPLPVRVAAGTAIAADNPSGGLPLVFETERAIGLMPGALTQVASLWPGRDTYADHSAAVAARGPVTPFDEATALPTPHVLYLGHDGYLALTGSVSVEVEIGLISPGSRPLPLVWETWDGQAWRPFGDPDVFVDPSAPATAAATVDGTSGLTRGGVVTLSGDCIDNEKTTVDGQVAYWLRARATGPLPPDPARIEARVGRIRINPVIRRLLDPAGLDPTGLADVLLGLAADPRAGVTIDMAMTDGRVLDLTRPFLPLGGNPAPGSEFAFTSEEVFSKGGADVRLAMEVKTLPAPTSSPLNAPVLSWEWYDGAVWNDLGAVSSSAVSTDMTAGVYLGFTVPDEGIPPATWRGQKGRWVRAVLRSGGYAVVVQIPLPAPQGGQTPPPAELRWQTPPKAGAARLAYVYRPPRAFPRRCLACNDFLFEDHTADARLAGPGFVAFRAVSDATPALYFGFDRPFPDDLVSLFLNARGSNGLDAGPALRWEMWDGATWSELATQDETANLVRPGMVTFVGSSAAPALARFGTSLYWVRARLREDGDPAATTVLSIDPNATWASQTQTIVNEVLGSGTGEPGQSFFAARPPVLGGEVVEVRELDGARAAVELPILARQVNPNDLNVVTDASGRVREVWVRWRSMPNLDLSGPGDRHYVIERTQGRIRFGDRGHGRTVPPGRDNIVARRYQTGGGTAGNVSAGAIKQLLASLPYVNGVTNPVAADGGADAEDIAGVRVRGPEALRHRGRAISARDYEALAREASPSVAVARAVPATGADGQPAAGRIKLVIMPRSQDPRPQPTLGLRAAVRDYVAARAPADLAGLEVAGPDYWPVGVNVTVAPVALDQAGPVGVAARAAIEAFLHPLTGGPDGRGWPPGRSVYVSDLAAAVAATPGLDHASELELTLEGIPRGDRVDVPPGRIIVAGPVLVRVRPAGMTC